MKKEYKTTGTKLYDSVCIGLLEGSQSYNKEIEELEPIPPDKTGEWDLVGVATTEYYVLWCWQREIKGES